MLVKEKDSFKKKQLTESDTLSVYGDPLTVFLMRPGTYHKFPELVIREVILTSEKRH
jgi:hypothetical protein